MGIYVLFNYRLILQVRGYLQKGECMTVFIFTIVLPPAVLIALIWLIGRIITEFSKTKRLKLLLESGVEHAIVDEDVAIY